MHRRTRQTDPRLDQEQVSHGEQPGRQSTVPLERMAELSGDVFLVSTLRGRIVRGNPAGARLHQIPLEQLVGMSIRDLIHPEGMDIFRQIPELLAEGGGSARYQIAAMDSNGARLDFDCLTTIDYQNNLVYTVERDITEETANRHDLGIAQHFFAMASDLLAMLDRDGNITRVNTAFEHFVGQTQEELVGRGLGSVLGLDEEESADHLVAVLKELVTNQQESRLTLEVSVKGERRALAIRVQPDLHLNTLFVAAHDITDEHLLTERLRRQASSDGLTGLANRAAFNLYLDQALATGHNVALAFLDLDKFKLINDSLGHAVGDELLRAVARRLESSVRGDDFLARLGGDEFCVIYTNPEIDEVTNASRLLLQSMSQPFEVGHRALHTHCSIGIAAGNAASHTSSELLSEADAAGYRAKHLGRNRFVVFDEILRDKIDRRFELENDLRCAIGRSQFDVDIQGIFFANDLQLAGVEALVRWNHPDRGIIYPDGFLGVAEKIGLMAELGDQVLDQALAHLHPWLHSSPESTLSINISPAQLIDPRLLFRLTDQITRYEVDPSQIVLEITETTLIDSIERTAEVMHQLRDVGFRLAMDDFGKGSSGLGYLRDLPFDIVKIDRGFVESLGVDSVNATIVEAVVSLARRLHMDVVAEGVETAEQVKLLRDFECTRLQGFYLHKPEPIATTDLVPTASSALSLG